MRYKKNIILFLFCSFNLLFYANDLSFSRLGMAQGLSQYSVMSLYQDELGSIWLGTREGVNRYNGYSIEVFKPIEKGAEGIAGSIVNIICGDHNGTLYFNTEEGVSSYSLNQNKFNTVTPSVVNTIHYGQSKLWVAKESNLYTYENDTLIPYFNFPNKNITISRILCANNGKDIYIGTEADGVFMLDVNKKLKQVIAAPCSQISEIYEDVTHNIWIGSWSNGLHKIENNGEIISYNKGKKNEPNTLSSNFIRSICEDNFGNIWVGTMQGINKIHARSNEITHYDASNENMTSYLSNESVWALLKDKQGTIWVGTYFGGANYFNPEVDFYQYHPLILNNKVLKPFPVISQIIEDENNNLFLCTEGQGLFYYNPQNKTLRTITYQDGDILFNIKSAYYDKTTKELFIGTHLGGIFSVNMRNNQHRKYIRTDLPYQPNEIVKSIIPYGNKLLLGTGSGLLILDRSNGSLRTYSQDYTKIMPYVDAALFDSDGNLWIGGRGAMKIDLKSGKYTHYAHRASDTTSLSNNNICKLFLDSKNELWLATTGGGVNRYDKQKNNFVHYNSHNCGLINDYVSNIAESPLGYLLIASTQGFSILDVEKNRINNYTAESGFPLISLLSGGICVNHKGEIFVAGNDGLISFYEDKVNISNKKSDIIFEELWVNNQLVKPNDKTGILKTALSYMPEIRLKSKHSVLGITFATNNYVKANQMRIEYQLVGYNDKWVSIPSTTNLLHFMNLNAGNYTLKIRGISPLTNDILSQQELKIHISPPFYKSWQAYILYLALFALLIAALIIIIRKISMMNASIQYEQREKQHIEEANQSKLRFFTNISHEFRTPLTLIAGQLEMLMQTGNIHPSVFSRILNIKKNVLMMQGLISELIEFRKSEQGLAQLKVSKHELGTFIYEIYISFLEYANYRNIKYEFIQEEEEKIEVWFDATQMQKVFYNLISNAFKYTPQGGRIGVKITHSDKAAFVSIFDNGVGISADSIEKIFDRFYQAENGLDISSHSPGSGIGLALSKGIVDAHGGSIEAKSQPQMGSNFIVTIQFGNNHFTPESMQEDPLQTTNWLNKEEGLQFIKQLTKEKPIQENSYKMLIVEDNSDLRILLEEIFAPLYETHTAADGEEGLAKTINLMPDIVLSDVMMPKMSGIEMCSKIKGNFNICHIPVILLTALTTLDHNIEGFNNGADDYFPKPFNVKILITRCNNLINARKLLHEKFTHQVDFSPRMVATNRLDYEFLEKATQIIEAHLNDNDFDIVSFSREMAMGRTTLFTKFKGVTGQTPNDFILTVRLRKAAFLLRNNPEYSIGDIAYMLGFNTPKYFSKCFKEQFKVSPLSFRNQQDEENDEGDEKDIIEDSQSES